MTVISRLKEKRKRGREGEIERERERKCPECGWLDGFPFLLIISRARQAGLGLYLADGKTIQSEGPWIENYRWVLCKFTLSFFFYPLHLLWILRSIDLHYSSLHILHNTP